MNEKDLKQARADADKYGNDVRVIVGLNIEPNFRDALCVFTFHL